MKTKFLIVTESTQHKLGFTVQQYINEGWQVVNAGYAYTQCWYAALIKEADSEEYTR